MKMQASLKRTGLFVLLMCIAAVAQTTESSSSSSPTITIISGISVGEIWCENAPNSDCPSGTSSTPTGKARIRFERSSDTYYMRNQTRMIATSSLTAQVTSYKLIGSLLKTFQVGENDSQAFLSVTVKARAKGNIAFKGGDSSAENNLSFGEISLNAVLNAAGQILSIPLASGENVRRVQFNVAIPPITSPFDLNPVFGISTNILLKDLSCKTVVVELRAIQTVSMFENEAFPVIPEDTVEVSTLDVPDAGFIKLVEVVTNIPEGKKCERTTVPTLSDWSLLVLAMLLAGSLAFMIRRRLAARPAGA
jgi:hypothetical protein